jgi:hypothetical protein
MKPETNETTTTRKAGGLDFPAPWGGENQKHIRALIVAVVVRPPEAGKPQADLKTTNHVQALAKSGLDVTLIPILPLLINIGILFK